MAQLDDIVGAVMQKLKDSGVDNNTIVVFTTDNGAENFTWPDGGKTPFAGGKGRSSKAASGYRHDPLARPRAGRKSGERHHSGLDWFPTLVAAAGDPNIADELKKGKQLDDQTYKVHLDGYNQMDLITGKGRPRVTRSSTLPRASSARCASTTRNIVHRSAGRLARPHGQSRLAVLDNLPA